MPTLEAEGLCLELATCRAMFIDNRILADRIARALTLEHFNWKPSPDRWSVAQCLVHLNISAELYAERIESAVHRGSREGMFASGPFHYGPLARWMLRAVAPGNPRKYKTPSRFNPPEAIYGVRDVLRAFHEAGTRWEHLLNNANGLDLERIRVRSPAVPLIKLSLGAAFEIQAAHERRHLLQAEQLLDMDR